MAEIDSLEVKIEADARKANGEIDSLVRKLGALGEALGGANALGLSGLNKRIQSISSPDLKKAKESVMGLSDSIRKIGKEKVSAKVRVDSSDYQSAIKETQKNFANAASNFTPIGSLEQMERQADKLSKKLENLTEREKKIISVGKVSPDSAMFQNLQYDIAETMNKLTALSGMISTVKEKSQKTNFQINRWGENRESSGSSEYIQKTTMIPKKSTQFNPNLMDAVFGESARNIKNYEQYVKEFGNASKNALSGVEEGAEKANEKTDCLGNKVEELKSKLKEIKAQGLNFGDADFDKAYRSLKKAEAELKEYKANLQGAGSQSSPFAAKSSGAFQNVARSIGLAGNALKSFSKGVLNAGKHFGSLIPKMKLLSFSAKDGSKGIGGLTSKIARLFIAFQSLRGAGGLLKGSLESASDYIEEYNYFDVSMDKIARESKGDFAKYGYKNAEEYADSFKGRLTSLTAKMTGFQIEEGGELSNTGMQNLGMDITQITNFESRIAQMTNSVGMIGEASIAASKGLTMLAGDMSSLTNTPLDQVMNNFSSATSGAAMAVKKYGIDTSVAALQELAYSLGVKKKISDMTQSEKEYLRIIAMINQSKVAWGDLANTINQPANQFRMLKNTISQSGMMLGRLFMPIVQKVLPWINAMASAVKDLIKYIGDLFGVKWDDSSVKAPDNDYGASDYDDVSQSAGNAADSIDKATDAQKKFNKQLQGFDRLNNLTSNKDSGDDNKNDGNGSGADVSGKLSDALINAVEDYEKRWNKAFKGMENKVDALKKKIVDLFKGAWLTNDGTDIGKAIAGVLNKGIDWVNNNTGTWTKGLTKIATIIGTAVNGFVEEFNWPGLGKAIGDSIKGALEAEEKFFDTVNWVNLGKGISSTLNAFVESGVIQQYFKTLASKVRGLIETAFGAITTFNFKGLGKALGEGINDFFAKMGKVNPQTGLNGWEELGVSISEGIKGIADTLITALDTVKWERVGQAIADFIGNIDMSGIGWKLGKLAKSLSNAVYTLVSNKDTWKSLGAKIASGINSFFKANDWKKTGKAIGSSIKGILDAIITALEGISWIKVGKSIGSMISKIDFSGIAWRLLGLAKSIVLGIAQALLGSFSKAPIETSIVTMLAGLKFSGKLNASTFATLGQKIAAAVGNAASSSGNVASLSGKLSTFFDTAIGSSATKLVKGAGIAAVVASVLSVAQNLTEKAAEKTFKGSKIGKIAEEVNKSVNNLKTSTRNLKTSLKEVSEMDFNSLDEVDNLDSLAKKYETLSKKEKLSAGEKVKLKQYSQKLIQQIPSLNSLIDKSTGKYKGQWSQLKKLVEQKKLQYKLDAKEKALKELGGDLYNSEENQKAAKKKRDDLQKQLTDLQKQHDKAIKENRKKGYDDSNLPLSRWADEEARLEEAVKKADKALKDSNKTLDEANKKFDDLAGSIEKDKSELKKTTKTVKDYKKELKASYKSMNDMKNKTVKFEIKNSDAKKSIKEIDDDIKTLKKKKNELKLKGDNADAKQKIKAVNDEIADLKAKKTTVEILGSNADAKTKLDAIETRRQQLNNREAIIKAKGDTKDAKDKLDAIEKERSLLNGKEVKIKGKVEISSKENTLNSTIKGINSQIEKKQNEIKKINLGVKNKDAKDKIKELRDDINSLKNKKIEIKAQYAVDHSSKTTLDAAKKVWKQMQKAKTGREKSALLAQYNQLISRLPALANGGVLKNGKWKNIAKYSSGGFPNMGQMFIAREKGPELVGRIGNHTAVMNNNQIVASVSDGVFNALNPVLTSLAIAINQMNASNGGNENITIQVDGNGLFEIVRDKNSQYKKRFGESAFT